MNAPLTIERVLEIGLGQLRFNPFHLYEMSIAEFVCAVRGFYEMSEIREQHHWERARWIATVLLQPHTKPNTRMKPTDVAQFPWEKRNEKTAVDGEQLLRQMMK